MNIEVFRAMGGFGGSGFYDEDAAAFIALNNTINKSEQLALHEYCVKMKRYGFWDRMVMIYPNMGTDITKTIYNLKNLSKNGTIVGTLTMDKLGVKGWAAANYIRTGIIDSVDLEAGNVLKAVYCDSGWIPSGVGIVIGASTTVSNWITLGDATSTMKITYNDNTGISVSRDATSYGLFISNKYALNRFNFVLNGVVIGNSNTNSNTTLPNVENYIGCNNSNGTHQYEANGGLRISIAILGKAIQPSEYVLFNELQQILINGKKRNNYYYFGDSITAGLDASPQTTNRWTAKLSTVRNSIEVNFGVSGSVLEDNRGATNNFRTRAIREIPLYRPECKLFIAYGLNDIGTYYPDDYNQINFEEDYNAIIDIAVVKGWPTNKIYIISPYYVLQAGLDSFSPNGANETRALTFVTGCQNVATLKGCNFIEMWNYLKGTDYATYLSGLHPNNDGHTIIFNRVNSLI